MAKPTQRELPIMHAERLAHFFSGCKNAANVSDVITSLAAGIVLPADRLPSELLAPVVLLATVGLRVYNQQIVDDYVVLLDRMSELLRDAFDTLKHSEVPNYWHPQLNLVSAICYAGPANDGSVLIGNQDAAYIFDLYEQLVNTDLDQLFQKGAA